MVNDVIVHKRDDFNGNGHLHHNYRGTDAYGNGANRHLGSNRDGDGKGAGEIFWTQGDYSGSGKGYARGYGYKNGAGYGFDNIGKPYNKYNFFVPISSSPDRWTKIGLMPQRADGAILVWKSVIWSANDEAWVGWFDWRYAVGQRYACTGAWVMPGPLSALANYFGGVVCNVMAIWAHRLLAHEGNKVEHHAAEGTPAAVYSVQGYNPKLKNADCAFTCIESDGTQDPLSLIKIESQPFFDGKRLFHPRYRYKQKRPRLSK